MLLEVHARLEPPGELRHQLTVVHVVADDDVDLGGVHGELGEAAHRPVVRDDELDVCMQTQPKRELPVVVLQGIGVGGIQIQDLSLVRVVAESNGDTRVPLEPLHRTMRELSHEGPLPDANRCLFRLGSEGRRDVEVRLAVSTQHSQLESTAPPGASQGGVEEDPSHEGRPLEVVVVGHAPQLGQNLDGSIIEAPAMDRVVLDVVLELLGRGMSRGIVLRRRGDRVGRRDVRPTTVVEEVVRLIPGHRQPRPLHRSGRQLPPFRDSCVVLAGLLVVLQQGRCPTEVLVVDVGTGPLHRECNDNGVAFRGGEGAVLGVVHLPACLGDAGLSVDRDQHGRDQQRGANNVLAHGKYLSPRR